MIMWTARGLGVRVAFVSWVMFFAAARTRSMSVSGEQTTSAWSSSLPSSFWNERTCDAMV